jgi:transposase
MLQLLTVAPVPADTMRVAKDAIPQGNACMALRDRLGAIFDDALFAPLFSTRGQPAAAPWRLAVVTILQFAERLSDRDAAEAVRTRIDWKYLLGLELSDADKMTAWKVDKAVGNVKNDSTELIEPASAAPESSENRSPEAPGSLFDA